MSTAMTTDMAIVQAVREAMRRWPCFQIDDEIIVMPVSGSNTSIGYRRRGVQRWDSNSIHWDANVIGDVFYLLTIQLPILIRGRGFGGQLYRIIESIAFDLGCREIRQTPSGETMTGESRLNYLLRRDWLPDRGEVYKRLVTNTKDGPMREAIREVPLNDQVLAVLRVWGQESCQYRFSSEIAQSLARPTSDVCRSLASLHACGALNRYVDGVATRYRVSDLGRRVNGCCCCCNAKLYDPSRPFCQECAPHFDGRI